MPYVELRAHTAFSFGDGATTPEALAARAKSLGYRALGITDTADLGGIVRFAIEARTAIRSPWCRFVAKHSDAAPCPHCEHTLRPIIGAELNVVLGPLGPIAPQGRRATRQIGYPIALLARTAEGYRNLASLITRARIGEWESWSLESQAERRGRPVSSR